MDLGWGTLASLARVRNFRSRRLSSWDRSGGNRDAIQIAPGAMATLGTISGAGCVRHIWMTMASIPREPHELGQSHVSDAGADLADERGALHAAVGRAPRALDAHGARRFGTHRHQPDVLGRVY